MSMKFLPFCSFQALEQYVMPHLRTYWNQLQQVLDDNSQSNALLQEEAYQVYGALLVCFARNVTWQQTVRLSVLLLP